MAIFGFLTDMPLPDVLSMVGRSSGKFTVWNTPSGRNYELHLSQGMLSAMVVDSSALSDVFQVRNRMVELMNMRTGEFEFKKQPAATLLANFNISIDTLLLSSLAALDEVEAYRPHFASSRTVFKVVPTKEAWLEGDLLEFWETCYYSLEEGASAESLSQSTGLFLDNILLSLYKLRTAGLIAPVRAFQNASPPADTLKTKTTTMKKPAISLTSSGNLTNSPLSLPLPPRKQPQPLPPQPTIARVEVDPDLTKVAVEKPPLSTLGKILGRLRNSFRSFTL